MNTPPLFPVTDVNSFLCFLCDKHVFLTFGMLLFDIFNIVTVVSRAVIPRDIRAGVWFLGIRKDNQDIITIKAQGP